jgi:hypothetical protein
MNRRNFIATLSSAFTIAMSCPLWGRLSRSAYFVVPPGRTMEIPPGRYRKIEVFGKMIGQGITAQELEYARTGGLDATQEIMDDREPITCDRLIVHKGGEVWCVHLIYSDKMEQIEGLGAVHTCHINASTAITALVQ